jgi:hypothetical protein
MILFPKTFFPPRKIFMNFLSSIENSGFSSWVRESPSVWAYPLVIFLHAVGLSMVVGLSSAIDLALLGFAPGLPLAPLAKLYRLIGAGFWINAISGIVLTIVDATTMVVNTIFWIKMVLIALAIANVLIIKKKVFSDPLLDKRPVAGDVRALAILSLVLWMAAVTAGRLTAYLGAHPGAIAKL